MKQQEAKELIIALLKEKQTITPQEISYATKGKLPFVQIYGIMSTLIKNTSVQLNQSDGKKSYTLIDESKLDSPAVLEAKESKKPAKEKPITVPIEDEEEEKKTPKKPIGRDLTKYKFNGEEYNKGRLAHALIAAYCKEKRPSLKGLLEVFPENLIPPYGTLKPIKEAKEMSKERQRFFIKPEEEIKIRDCSIAVSNQWTSDRIEKLIAIAKKLGYKVK